MRIENTPAVQPIPGAPKAPTALEPAHQPRPEGDTAKLGAVPHGESDAEAVAHYPLEDKAHAVSVVDKVAHKAHHPHGAMHAVEAGEAVIRTAGRALARGGRAASTAATATEAAQHAAKNSHHVGLLHKAEHVAEKGLVKGGNWLANLIRRAPGGKAVMNAVNAVWRAPGRLLGRGATVLDGAIAGSKAGQAVKLVGGSGRFVAQMGGRLPIVGAVLGGAIAAVDIKSSLHVLGDKKATTAEKWIAGLQGAFSGVSGLLGVGALGVAGAAAVGLTAPVSVPLLLGAAAVTGAVAFGLSFFKKH